MDSQWPRFEVFQKFAESEPHSYAGSVHAPDAELALLNARDVFVRRPSCLSLWVVPAGKIFTRTAQELEDEAWLADPVENDADHEEPYLIFQKLSHKGTLVHRGQVEALNHVRALQRALDTFSDQMPLVWWVVPAGIITESRADEVDSMFEPAWDKFYRQPMDYHTVALMRQIRSKKD
jgi:ring-1,2-phenylacetyl-CoA epoxidase subunit PaaB